MWMKVYMTKVWGFGEPCSPLQFSSEGWRNNAAEKLQEEDVVILVGTLNDNTDPSEQGIILGVPIFIHPAKGLKFSIVPLYAILEQTDHSTSTHGETSTHKYFGIRAGIAYDIHVGNFSITPTFSADYINSAVSVVYGLGFGVGF